MDLPAALTMRGAVLNRPGEVEVVERPGPTPEAAEVLVRVPRNTPGSIKSVITPRD